MKKSQSVPVHSLGKAMELLEILLQHRSALSLGELTELSGYPKSTIYALLATMMEYSVITQLPNGKYYLGMKLFECGCAVSGQWDISALAYPYLEDLANISKSSAFISVMDGDCIINVEQATASSGIQVASQVGFRLPLHATSQGKLFLSALSDVEIKSKMKTLGMPSFTPHTICTLNELIANIHTINESGYSVENGEYKIGLRSVAAPIYNHQGKMIYAVGVVGLFRSIYSEEFTQIIEQVKSTATHLSNAIGYR